MVQNIHPLGIKTLFLPLLVLRLIVFPSCPFMALLNGKVTSKPYLPFFMLSSLELKVGIDIATKRCINDKEKRNRRTAISSVLLALNSNRY